MQSSLEHPEVVESTFYQEIIFSRAKVLFIFLHLPATKDILLAFVSNSAQESVSQGGAGA